MNAICESSLGDGSIRRPVGGDSSPDAAWYPVCKVLADAIVAGMLLVLAAPVILILMALVRLTSRGPAIYKQRRLGLGGRPYEILKLRSMRHDCERLTGPLWAKAGDTRVTPLGRFLRRSHLDELPQLWNVIRGEMSLVGPRPERPEFVAELELVIPDYRERMQVRPGITGLAQVQLPADANLDDVRRKVRCDLHYVRRMTPWLDLKIMLGTLMIVAGVSFEQTRRFLDLPVVEESPSSVEDSDPMDQSKVAHHLQSI
jgi:lipopolysaccharide/colanic/teichoic acid biosynthesis glycosyltransferase